MRRLGFTHTLHLVRPLGAALAATLAMACTSTPANTTGTGNTGNQNTGGQNTGGQGGATGGSGGSVGGAGGSVGGAGGVGGSVGGSGGGGAPAVNCVDDQTCDVVGGEGCGCNDCLGTPECGACDNDASCEFTDACTCQECYSDGYCSSPTCTDDGICDGFNEGCSCADCAGTPNCAAFEDCGNGVDDNANGLADCNDPVCASAPGCAEDCSNGVDDNGDMFVDCNDPQCTNTPACGVGEDCTNQFDDDGDGDTDCDDSDCAGNAACPPAGWTCTASWYDESPPNEFCDCECGIPDPDCAVAGVPLYCNGQAGQPGETCNAQNQCVGGPTPENCSNGVDDDGDGQIDCADSNCAADPFCTAVPPGWTCNPAYYNEQPPATEYCDCECGAVDPDCSNPANPVDGCLAGEVCNAQGLCEAGGGVPPGWTCNPGYYDALDGCDCSCGAHDPDCDVAGQTLYCGGAAAPPGTMCVNDVCQP